MNMHMPFDEGKMGTIDPPGIPKEEIREHRRSPNTAASTLSLIPHRPLSTLLNDFDNVESFY